VYQPSERAKLDETHRAAFFRGWLKDPFAVASIWPSGRLLAKIMARGLHPGARVVELGAGTGNLTQAILDAGVLPRDLFLVEQNPDFVAILRRRFPDVGIAAIDAASVATRLPELFGAVDYVVSGLPILWFKRSAKARILGSSFELLRAGGCFHQFTYAGRPPVGRRLLASLGLRASLLGISPINIPPAFAYRFERAAC
jgi:phosphatidylethanolamine/phosphatidyl-N-methylethanolamine N-methyltransferase